MQKSCYPEKHRNCLEYYQVRNWGISTDTVRYNILMSPVQSLFLCDPMDGSKNNNWNLRYPKNQFYWI